MLNQCFDKEFFPNVQPERPLAQVEAVSLCPTTSCLGEKANLHLATIFFQVVV